MPFVIQLYKLDYQYKEEREDDKEKGEGAGRQIDRYKYRVRKGKPLKKTTVKVEGNEVKEVYSTDTSRTNWIG